MRPPLALAFVAWLLPLPTAWEEYSNPVSIKDCNMTHPCNSDDHYYDCESGTFAKQTIVKYNTGEACTTYNQCIADRDNQASGNPPLCGPECADILANGGGGWFPSTDDDPESDDDNSAFCDQFGDDIPWWAEQDCSGRGSPTPSPTPRPRDENDCSGYKIPANDPQQRRDWLGDGGCDNDSWEGAGANFNCKAWGYDCCDCRSSCDPQDYAVCDGVGRRRMVQDETNNESKDAGVVRSYADLEVMVDLKVEGISHLIKERMMDNYGIVWQDAGPETEEEDSFDAFMRQRQLVTTNVWTTMCVKCQKGTFCPEGSTVMEACPPGFYCPNPEKKVKCPDNYVCVGYRKKECKAGMYCPYKAQESAECPGGSYCSEPQYISKCPPDHYCRGGDTYPRKCAFYMKCPAGTTIPSGSAAAFISLLVTVAVLFRFIKFLWDLSKKRAIARKKLEEARNSAHKNVATFFAQLKQKKASTKNLGQQIKADESVAATKTSKDSSASFLHLKPDKTQVFFEFHNLALVLKNGTRIIDRVTGKVDAGKLTAIMGPSGCGKTSMLNVLRNKAQYGTITGQLKVNGKYDSIAPLMNIVGFVPQEDILHSELTVEDAIFFSSLLKNSFTVSTWKRKQMVNEIIEVLGLEKCRKSVIGDQEIRGVSGGQRKRVSIAVELVGNPSICFLDEPTSGLDSTTSIELIETLKNMATAGMTLVMVIHQPRYEIFETIDNCLLLGQNGRPVYMGPSGDTLTYFSSIGFPCPNLKSPADHFLDVMSGAVPHAKENFTTKDLSDWWEDGDTSKSVFDGSNPIRAEQKPPKFSAMEVEFLEKHAEGSADKLRAKLAPTVGVPGEVSFCSCAFLRICIVEFFEHIGMEIKEAIKAFKPSMISKYRVPPSNIYQFLVCLVRAFKQMFAEHRWGGFVSDCLTMFCIGAVLGFMFGADNWRNETQKLPLRNFITILAIGLTSCLRALGTFGGERPVFWRERNGGTSTLSYYMGKISADIIFITVYPACFLFMLVGVAQPRASFAEVFPILWLTSFAASSVGYLISCLFRPEVAKFNGLMIILLCSLFSGVQPPLTFFKGPVLEFIVGISYARWGQEALIVLELQAYPDLYDSVLQKIMDEHGWDWGSVEKCKKMLLTLGIAYRVLAFLLLKLGNRQKG